MDDEDELNKLLNELDLEDIQWEPDELDDRLFPLEEERPSWMD